MLRKEGVYKAEDRDRTGVTSLEDWSSTIELLPRTHLGYDFLPVGSRQNALFTTPSSAAIRSRAASTWRHEGLHRIGQDRGAPGDKCAVRTEWNCCAKL